MLILAPEAYLPLREVGARFHASIEGVAAAQQVFAVLDGPVRRAPSRSGAVRHPAARPGRRTLRLDGVRVTYPDRAEPALSTV